MISPGCYVLTRDVTNPAPDRRKTTDWRALPVWPAGWEFIAKAEEEDRHGCRVIGRTRLIRVGHRWTMHAMSPDYHSRSAKQYVALEAALAPCEESSAAMFTRLGCDDRFARWLVESGRVDRALFEILHDEYKQDGQLRNDDPYPARRCLVLDDAGRPTPCLHLADSDQPGPNLEPERCSSCGLYFVDES